MHSDSEKARYSGFLEGKSGIYVFINIKLLQRSDMKHVGSAKSTLKRLGEHFHPNIALSTYFFFFLLIRSTLEASPLFPRYFLPTDPFGEGVQELPFAWPLPVLYEVGQQGVCRGRRFLSFFYYSLLRLTP